MLATGVHWDFAPAVSVPQDIRWGRTYEGYSQQTDIVTELSAALIRGLATPNVNDHWVLPSVKHFVGDGGAGWGTSKRQPWVQVANWQSPTEHYMIDQGDAQIDEATLRERHLAPYVNAIEQGALNIMVSFSSWNGDKMHGHKYLLTDVLKGELGFEGFLVSDWMAIDQLDEDFYTCVVTSINAGLDMIMVPFDYQRFINTLTKAVEQDDVSQERIDDAVRRILRAKFALGLFESPLADPSWLEMVGAPEHREVAQEAVRKSLVLLKNENAALPLDKNASVVYVAGEAADDIGLACGGWSIDWLGSRGAITTGKTLVEGMITLEHQDVQYNAEAQFAAEAVTGIVVIAEETYAEGMGDRKSLELNDEQKALISRMREQCEKLVLIIYSGRPLIITDVVDQCDAVVAAWLPGTEAHAIADVLYGDAPFTGKLAYSWPRSMDQIPLSALQASSEPPLWPFGYGLTTS
jgi:beta-glucosidase